MLSEYVITVPGWFKDGYSFLDIETRKVKLPEPGFYMRNGGLLKMRWQVFMAGVARNRQITLIEHADSEGIILDRIGELVHGSRIIGYSAGSRQFDEMVLKGKFTNARRAHELVSFYPFMPCAEDMDWVNYHRGIRSNINVQCRLPDIESKDVPRAEQDGRIDLVLVHMLRDVAEVILDSGYHDSMCGKWCKDVLTKHGFANDEIFRGEHV
ncbi:MAG TPA: hypothetical protein VNS88_09755 [Nitrospiraceae bacterium]|nr:hypothetical protein [Nitrospiraceae bacterium]